MKSANCQSLRLCLSLGLLLFLVPLAAHPSGAQAPPVPDAHTQSANDDADEAPSAYISLELDDAGSTQVTFDSDTSLAQKYNFREVLSTALGCPLKDIDLSRDDQHQTSEFYARCDFPLRRSLLGRTGAIDLQPIKDVQKAEPQVDLTLDLTIQRHDFVRCEPAPERLRQGRTVYNCLYPSEVLASAPPALHFEFGYSKAHAIRVNCILGILLLIPIALTFWFRYRASSAPDETKTAVWFAYRRFLTWTAILGTLVWWAAIDLLQADEFLKFLIPFSKWTDDFGAAIFPGLLLWIPPAVVYFLCLSLSSPMRTLRGTKHTQGQILNQSFWAVARFVLPLFFIFLGFAELSNSPRLAVLLIAAGFVSGKFATGKFARAYGIELHSLTSGELRDRAFAMAQKANAKLNQLYVLPAESMRMANAFAHVAQNVYLTDYLVNNLNKDEVDAVVGHELTHLQNRHPGRRLVVTYIAIIGIGFAAGFLEDWFPRGLPNGPILYSLLLLGLFFVSRRNEFAADAGSVKLTGNAEAMITALARITRLNTMPLQWSKVDEKLLTHPSTLRRIRRLARDAKLSEARTAELLSQSLAPPSETYAIPPTALPAGKLFSTRYKTQFSARFSWATMLTTAVVAAVVAFIAQWRQWEGGTLWLAYLVGILLILFLNLALLNFFPLFGFSKMERLLREKCGPKPAVDAGPGSIFVSLAPDSTPRIYEGNWDWDLGFLSLTHEHLSYCGEEARFVLHRDEITSIAIGPGPAGWFRAQSVYVSWRDSADREGTLNLRPSRARSMREIAGNARLLARDLENWYRGLPVSSNPIIVPVETVGEALPGPAFGQVTSMSPRTLARRYFAYDLFVNTLLAIGAIILFGLGTPIFGSLTGSADSLEANRVLGGFYVLIVVWITRVFVRIPLWRVRERASPSGNTPVASEIHAD